jgi:hypothetical protein
MKVLMKVLLGIACLLLIECTPRAPTVTIRDARTRAPAVALRAVTVVDVMDGSLRDKQTILVAGNRITAVGPADQVRIPRDAESARLSPHRARFRTPAACGTSL